MEAERIAKRDIVWQDGEKDAARENKTGSKRNRRKPEQQKQRRMKKDWRQRDLAIALLSVLWCVYAGESLLAQEAVLGRERQSGTNEYVQDITDDLLTWKYEQSVTGTLLTKKYRALPAGNVSAAASAESGPALNAQSAVLMDADTGRILYAKDAATPRPMASTTKIMTCILALEYGDLNDTVTVSSYAASQPKVHLGAPAGRSFRLEDLLYSLMLESHNDTAVMIAEHIGGSVGGFAEMMNQKARELGCENTWFVTPNGLDAASEDADGTERQHSTTAGDLAAIMAYCVWQSPKKEEFLKITEAQNHYFTDLEGKGSYSCCSHNALLNMMGGVISGKTGFTGGAGYCYVAALEDNGRRYTLALLGCGWPPHKTYKWSDARKLFRYGMEHYEKKDVFQEPKLAPLTVTDGLPESGDLAEQARVELTLNLDDEEKTFPVLLKEGEQVLVRKELPDTIKAPVRRDAAVGRIEYVLDGTVIRTYPVYAAEDVPEITWNWCAGHILGLFLP